MITTRIPSIGRDRRSGLFLAGLLCLMIFGKGLGQSNLRLQGKVLDRKSNTPLAYANVSLSNSWNGTVCNEAGEFEFNVSSNFQDDTLAVSFVGYHTYKVKVSDLNRFVVILLEEAPVVLKDVVINAELLSAEQILKRAVDSLILPRIHPDPTFKLEGFYRELHQVDGRTSSLVEAAFNIYDNSTTQPMRNVEIVEFRKIFAEGRKTKTFDQNSLLMLYDVSTNFVVLAKLGLKEGKTTWAIGRRPYTIANVSIYNGKEVFIIVHDNEYVSLKIIIDAENFSVIRNEYHSTQNPENYKNYFWKYRQQQSPCGFYETHQIYEYREFKGKMYPYFFYRKDRSKCFDPDKSSIKNENSGSYQALISHIRPNEKRPKNLQEVRRGKGMHHLDFTYNAPFWQGYNIIKGLPLDTGVVRELGGRKVLEEKFSQ
jgi:hypothetical protein